MDRLWSFLKNEYRIFITLLYVCLIFGGVFLFANLDMQYFILSLELILFCMFVFLIIEWISYVKREKMSEEIERLQIENNTLRKKGFGGVLLTLDTSNQNAYYSLQSYFG